MSLLGTRHDALREATRRLLAHDVENAAQDALALLAHASGTTPLELASHASAPLDDGVAARFEVLVGQRAERVPLQHLVGTVGFHAIELEVDERVLVPRPETEVLVDAVLEWLDERHLETARVLDLGTGSGAIALALAYAQPHATVIATDASCDAITVARRNARRIGVERRVAFVSGRWLEPVRVGATFDVIVSNPPYVATGEIDFLAPEVREHDPRLALDGGIDGLEPYRVICAEAARHLRRPGLLALEVAHTRAPEVAALAATAGFTAATVHADLDGRPRVVVATR